MSLRPSAAAIKRIAAVGETEFLAFLDEISPKGAREVANILPTIPGFRKSSESGLRQRKRKLGRRSSQQPKSRPPQSSAC